MLLLELLIEDAVLGHQVADKHSCGLIHIKLFNDCKIPKFTWYKGNDDNTLILFDSISFSMLMEF